VAISISNFISITLTAQSWVFWLSDPQCYLLLATAMHMSVSVEFCMIFLSTFENIRGYFRRVHHDRLISHLPQLIIHNDLPLWHYWSVTYWSKKEYIFTSCRPTDHQKPYMMKWFSCTLCMPFMKVIMQFRRCIKLIQNVHAQYMNYANFCLMLCR
jgi:hypothetical protein